MKKVTIFLIAFFFFLSFFVQTIFSVEETGQIRRIHPGDGARRDSLLWQRMGRDFPFGSQKETEVSHKSMVDTRCNSDGFMGQNAPAISVAGDSTLVAAWMDHRHGFDVIYAQRFDMNCNPVGSDFKVSDYWTNCDATNPDVAVDASGNFILVWDDHRNSNFDVFAQRYNAAGAPLGGNFKVNYNTDDSHQYSAKIARNASGNFVIVWEDWQDHGPYYYPYVYGQRYNSSGVPQGSNFKVNDLDLGAYDPDVAMDSVGNFMVVWEESQGPLYSSDIYGQAYNPSGQRVGNNFRINSDSLYLKQFFPAVTANNQGKFIVVWVEWDPEQEEPWSRLSARRYSSSGVPDSGSFRISLEDTISQKDGQQAVMDANGNFVVGWASYLGESAHADIYAQRYNHLNQPQGSNFKVNDDVPVFLPVLSMTMNTLGNFFMAWSDDRIDNEFEQFRDPDIYCQRYNSSGIPQGNNVRLNSENPDNLQEQPSISVDNTGSFVLAWTDWRNENWSLNHYTDIFGLVYEQADHPEIGNHRVNTDEIANGHTQNSPTVAGYGSKQILTAWADLREGDWDIYAVRGFYGGEYKVNEDVSPGNWDPSVAVDSLGNFVVVWTDSRNGYPKFDIYAQRYNSVDQPQGSNFRVNEEPFYVAQEFASVDMNAGGDFVVVWEDFRESGGTSRYIYGQRFNHLGQPQGLNFKVNDLGLTFPGSEHYYPDVAIDRAGSFVVAWQRYSDIYAQRYNSSGQRIGGNFVVNDEPSLKEWPLSWERPLTPSKIESEKYPYTSPRLGVDMDRRGNFVIVWSDDRNGNFDIYAQRYHFTGMAWGGNYRVNTDVGGAMQANPSVVMDDSCIYYAWLDHRVPEYDWDVYVKVDSWRPRYLPGDANGDNIVTSADVTYLINYLYIGGPPPNPINAGDPNADCRISGADIVYLVNYLFLGGPVPQPGCRA